ncbi:MAG: NAD(P)/FAD-dependent oxidoreductase [Deltaproteobacteria bacterium]|nr:NAD(P)/FAD-dependent oxidoreductase [Deltaproteobacteria bacterium]
MQLWQIEGLSTIPGESEDALRSKAARALSVDVAALVRFEILRRSLDARKKGQPLFKHTVIAGLDDNTKVRADRAAKPFIAPPTPAPLPKAKRDAKIVIIGAGPAGLFAALRLKDAGLRPVILERGKAVEPRAQDVQRFKRQRVLDEESNYCFGEGGAGTWSDGKLTTRIGDARVEHVLKEIVRLGGPPEILIDGKPHLGTNRLVKLLRAIRTELTASGAEIRFEQKAERFVKAGGALKAVRTHSGDELACEALILANGHSARDVFSWMLDEGVALAAKAFSVGFRVEHPQVLINEMQYGRGVPHDILPAADYRLTDNLELDGHKRGVYSFCMCPGGVIVPTATEPGGICINGMSHASRSSPWANSAVVVSVEPEDFGWGGKDGVLSGIDFQRRAERLAFERGGGDFRAPAQRVTDFLAKKPTQTLAQTSFRPGVVPTSLDGLYPAFVTDALTIALQHWAKRMRGYVTDEAYMLGVETRTSSPVRIVRDDSMQSPSLRGLFPVGEGAGYAGGIMSAAVDGIRAADAILAGL